MVRIAEVVNWHDLRDAIGLSIVAGVGLTSAYGFVLLGFVRTREYYEHGELAPAALYGAVGLAGLAITVGGIVLGLAFLSKDG